MIPLLLSAFLINTPVAARVATVTDTAAHELELPPVVINPRKIDDSDAKLQLSIIRDANDAITLLLI